LRTAPSSWSRYVHNLAVDHAAPAYLDVGHPRHKSPHRASTFVSIVAALILLPFILVSVDGTYLYAVLIGLGAVGILILMSLVSASVVAWWAQWRAEVGERVEGLRGP
jgi:amino acid transporter